MIYDENNTRPRSITAFIFCNWLALCMVLESFSSSRKPQLDPDWQTQRFSTALGASTRSRIKDVLDFEFSQTLTIERFRMFHERFSDGFRAMGVPFDTLRDPIGMLKVGFRLILKNGQKYVAMMHLRGAL